MNNRSRRPLHTALMRLAAAALAAAAWGASTARADSIVYVKGNAIWASSPDGKRQVQLAANRRFASPSQADDGTIVALGDDNHLYRFSRGGKPIGKPVAHVARPQRRLGLRGALSAARLARRHEGGIHVHAFAGSRPGHRHIAGGRRHVATPTSTG